MIEAIRGTDNVKEILLIDDCSKSEFAVLYDTIKGVTVIHRPENGGKDKSILTGYERSSGDYILILDGDLIGLTRSHLNALQKHLPEYQIIRMTRGDDYAIAKFFGLTYITAGEHLVSREVIDKYKPVLFKEEEWSFEYELNGIITGDPALKIKFCELAGVRHIMKEKKYGFWTGLFLGTKMVSNVFVLKYKLIGYLLVYLSLHSYIRDREKIRPLEQNSNSST